ncbi:phage tail protein [Rhodohalobacter sulfatireducens]|uniref:Phage tail protein n=1 Tax=Rhodohalobacter sulfatireducens TaxID=2911366 RepID=A0ABS9KI98_9BACT|nr:phage tail protein [Rhodohalobacter sulfatireducens]MCG2590564.1 phage tail protein [Rhodohalobacter sulfatireducens]
MAGEQQEGRSTQWPLPKFYFTVDLGADSSVGEVPFQEVSGMEIESQTIEYHAENDKRFSTVKMPGMVKSGNLIMKKGMFKDDTAFWEWYKKIKMNTIARTTITINLLDESASPLMTWVLANAWPTKITVTDMKTDANEVLVDTIEIVHEGITQNHIGR